MTGGGNVMAFDLGTRAAAWAFLDALEIVDISNNLGDAKSMATHPSHHHPPLDAGRPSGSRSA